MTKKEIEQYRTKMKRYNEFELKQLKKQSYTEKLDIFFRLLADAYKIYNRKEIEKHQQRKIQHLAQTQKRLKVLKNIQ